MAPVPSTDPLGKVCHHWYLLGHQATGCCNSVSVTWKKTKTTFPPIHHLLPLHLGQRRRMGPAWIHGSNGSINALSLPLLHCQSVSLLQRSFPNWSCVILWTSCGQQLFKHCFNTMRPSLQKWAAPAQVLAGGRSVPKPSCPNFPEAAAPA